MMPPEERQQIRERDASPQSIRDTANRAYRILKDVRMRSVDGQWSVVDAAAAASSVIDALEIMQEFADSIPSMLAEIERLEKFNETQMRFLLPEFFKEKDKLEATVERLEKESEERFMAMGYLDSSLDTTRENLQRAEAQVARLTTEIGVHELASGLIAQLCLDVLEWYIQGDNDLMPQRLLDHLTAESARLLPVAAPSSPGRETE